MHAAAPCTVPIGSMCNARYTAHVMCHVHVRDPTAMDALGVHAAQWMRCYACGGAVHSPNR